MKVDRYPGPFIGPDAELARACAMAVLPFYGMDEPDEYQRILKDGIWNDHVAVQAALAAIHNMRAENERLRKTLDSCCGYMLNAKIDLETGTKKRTTIQTLEGGLKMVRAAIGKPT